MSVLPELRVLDSFVEAITSTAVSLFLDPDDDLRVRPFLLLIDTRGDARENSRNIHILMDKRFRRVYKSELFRRVLEIDQDLPRITARKNASDSLSDWAQDRKKYFESISQTVKSVLDVATASRRTFVYDPVEINGMVALIVLQVQQTAFERYQIRSGTKYKGRSLFIECLAEEYLKECYNFLVGFAADPHREPRIDKSDLELLRRTGQRVMEIASKDESSSPSLFDAMDAISAQRYERKVSRGRVSIAQRSESLETTLKVTLRPAVAIRENPRAIRKLLELCGAGHCLWFHEGNIMGLGGQHSDPKKGFFSVEFRGHHIWELWYRNQPIMRVTDGRPELPRPKLQEFKFRRVIEHLFAGHAPNVDALWSIVKTAVDQDHGTTIIISSAARKESTRLGTQSTPILPTELQSDVIPNITAIDGGLLVDSQGTCYAIGALLDGVVTEGDLSHPQYTAARGSRYNSSVRYVKTTPAVCVVVVVSDDGMAELVHLPISDRSIKKSSMSTNTAAD